MWLDEGTSAVHPIASIGTTIRRVAKCQEPTFRFSFMRLRYLLLGTAKLRRLWSHELCGKTK
jgi:hypothetical protein